MPEEAKVHRGSCLCGAVQFSITGEPFSFYVCHCVNCRKISGSAFMSNAFFKPEQVAVTKGSEQVKVYSDKATTSGEPLPRSFCSTCGSSLFIGDGTKGFKVVATGAMDGEVVNGWTPKGERFPEYKRTWVQGIKTQPKRPSSKL